MKEHLVKTRGLNPENVSVVINWQDESEFIAYQEKNKAKAYEKFTFMYMGNIGPVAGVDLLIDAFSKVKITDSRLVIAGSGSMKEMLKEKAKNNPNVEFWDVPNGKVPEIQAQADVMLLPIKKGAASSSIPSKLPAYMFSAKPIIGCMDEDSYTAEAIRESKGGFVIEPENAQSLTEMMAKMAAMDAAELETIGKSGQRYALEHFAKTKNLTKLVNAIESVL
jgi:glycosyltransferase involved in cell wall biosynthesis